MDLFVLLFVGSGIKVFKEWDRIAVLRLGKFLGIKGPGITWMTPILDKGIVVFLKIQQTPVDTGKYVSSDGSTRWLILGDTVLMDEESLYSDIHQELEPTLTSWGVKIIEIKLKTVSE